MRNLRTSFIFLISFTSPCFAQNGNQGNIVLLSGILPFSLFLLSLVLVFLYLNKDKTDEKKVLGFVAWTASIFNAFYGFTWTFYFLKGMYTAILGAPIFSYFTLVFFSLIKTHHLFSNKSCLPFSGPLTSDPVIG